MRKALLVYILRLLPDVLFSLLTSKFQIFARTLLIWRLTTLYPALCQL